MPLFKEDPAHLSKSRLKSDLVAHNVALPPAKSRKEVYVELHLKHVDQKNAADFSSDEEDQGEDVAVEEEDAEVLDPCGLTDDDLKAALLKHGFKAGPIVASTRALYENKLRKLLQPNGHERVNGPEKDVLYSDSEEGEEEDEEEEEEGSDAATEETVEQPVQVRQQRSQNGEFVYPQCFVPSSRLRAHAPRIREPCPKRNSRNVLKSSERSWSRCSQIPAGISKASSVDQRSGLGSGVSQGSQSAVPNGCSSFSSQAFSITQMVEEMESQRSLISNTDTEKELNGSNVQERWTQSNRLDTWIVDKRNRSMYYTPEASPYKQEIKPPLEPVKDLLNDLFPDTQVTPTGIYATRRKPIKGAAGRPFEYVHPDSPASPTTLERRELERRLVPVHIQIFIFLIVVVLLYVIYACVEENSLSPFMALLDGLNPEPDSEGELLLQAEVQDTPAPSGEE
ncbi:LEM domain-containing protein 1 isoform X1 [Acanthopagrus latus]|uniref:LEM domain-containing protein 1 isoform X1 n=1 Tax=Acanthopagrus latus TaxID=8177 RepID=UPI00187CA9A9|nr:LEM domain-containing protein 1 isoform X1 [Acanthopagrus latus]